MNPDEVFTQHRGLMLRLAYDITGSWSDAEDVTQQAWERWHRADVVPDQPRAYLARIATNLAPLLPAFELSLLVPVDRKSVV